MFSYHFSGFKSITPMVCSNKFFTKKNYASIEKKNCKKNHYKTKLYFEESVCEPLISISNYYLK